MKKKYVSVMVLAALLGAQCYTGGVEAARIENVNDPGVSAVFVGNDAVVSKDLSDTSIEENSQGKTVYGVLATNGGKLTSDSETIHISATNTATSTAAGSTHVIGVGANAYLGGDKNQYTTGGTIELGKKGVTKDITISATANAQYTYAIGLSAIAWANSTSDSSAVPVTPGKILVSGDTLTIDVEHNWGDRDACGAVGIMVQNNTTKENISDNERSSVIINTDKTIIDLYKNNTHDDATLTGIQATSQGLVDIKSDLLIRADYAIVTRGDSIVNINTDGQHSTKLYGDMNFAYTNTTGVDSKVNVNLTGEDSVWEGNSLISGNPTNTELLKVNGFHVDINDGAQWITDENSFVNALSMDGGIINMVGNNAQTLDVYTVDGSGTINMKTEKTENGFSVGTLNIDSVATDKTARLGVNFMGINADDISTDKTEQQKQMNTLAGNINFGNGTGIDGEKLTATATVGEGLINGGISAVMNTATGETGTIQQNNTTTTMDNMRDIAAVSIAAWRQEDSTLSQRLGDLRESKEGQGIWARMNRGEFEYSGAFKNQYNYFQIGYDMAKGDWHYGAAVSHTDGETSYANGYGENDSTSLSLYGTRLMNDGQYLDLVLKVGRLSNEFDNYATAGHTHGDYDAWGTAISGEYGKKLDLKEGWFVTPQAQLSLMRIGGEDYTTSNKIAVSQDTLYSAVGRVGFEAGKDTGWGSFYAKASVLHEFAGDADTYVRLGDLSNSYSQDLGDTWYEAGFGFNWKMGNGSYFYADVIRTFGGDIETPWQWNAGVRWGF